MPSNDAATDEENIDAVHSILSGTPFKIRQNDEKLLILKNGRPLFNINVTKTDTSSNCGRTFHPSWYSIHKWLCGSENYNKLFCWPCLLMRPETSSWCSIGNDDMKQFTSLAGKHARCKSHLKAIHEYDETLNSFGLPPEFLNELKFKCLEEEEEDDDEEEKKDEKEGSLSDKTEGDDEFENPYFNDTEGKEKLSKESEANESYKVKPTLVDYDKDQSSSKINAKITFKSWQEMCKNNFLVSKSRFFEDIHSYKLQRKIAKQELRNARLAGEKLKFEIEVLKAKIDYYKTLKQNLGTGNGPSVCYIVRGS